ncbi:MAG: glycosyltransferase family 2 protein [Ruminococcus sp.]|nr:glycosyltransferase family 2 protein [Ruminococcus sp.]
MKKISIVIPTYNEQENVVPLSEAIISVLEKDLSKYDYEIIFIDNYSTDNTRTLLKGLCSENKRIKAIFNCKNFGQFNSPYYGLCQSTGDCTILVCADFQDPIELIPEFVKEWENGYKIVIGVKKTSRENKIMRAMRTAYYKLIKKLSSVEQIEHFTGFGLYDKSFIKVLSELNDPSPFLRGIVAELGPERKEIPYEQQKRRAGKTKNNWYSLYDAAMLSFTSYTKIGLRMATFLGFLCAALSFLAAAVYLVLKFIYWERFAAGMIPMLIGMFFIGSLQLFFIGFVGEYIMSINTRVIHRPLVIEEKRYNFDDADEKIK